MESGYNDAEVVASFLPDKVSVLHSFSITENFVIFFFTPLIMKVSKTQKEKYIQLQEWFQVDLWTNWSNNFHLFLNCPKLG